MKKHLLIIYMLLLIGVPSVSLGQSLPIIYKNPTNGLVNKIRYNNSTGKHIMYSFPYGENHFALTDISNTAINAKIASGQYVINDFEIFEDYVIFCGRTYSSEGMIGWFHIDDLFMAGVPAKFDPTLDVLGIASLENIEVYRDDKKNIHIAGYGVGYSGTTTIYKGFEAVGPTLTNMKYRVETFPDEVCDLTVTDNYVAYVGPFSSIVFGSFGVMLYMFPKNDMFYNTYFSTAYYQTAYHYPSTDPGWWSVLYIQEPLYPSKLKITHVDKDTVATLSYKLRRDPYPPVPPSTVIPATISHDMVLRTYDLSTLASGNPVVMHSAYDMIFNGFPSLDMYAFEYDPMQKTYSVFQQLSYPSTPADNVVTQIDFQSGVPSWIPNYYWTYPNLPLSGFCLSGSPYYTVCGYDPISYATYFWQDQYTSTPTNCINKEMLPFSSIAVEDEKMDIYPSTATGWVPLNYVLGAPIAKVEDYSCILCKN